MKKAPPAARPSSGVANTVRQNGSPGVVWVSLKGQNHPLLVTEKEAADWVGVTGDGGGSTATSGRSVGVVRTPYDNMAAPRWL